MAKGKLSDRQRNILAFIKKFSQERGYPPTIRQIGEATGISSTSVVNYNLNKLEKEGYLTREMKISRGVRLVDVEASKASGKGVISIPLAGFIFASRPVMVGDAPQTATDEVVTLTRDLVHDSGDLFALRVKGDSMIDAMVNDGDIVVMKKVNQANNGDMVAVWLNERQETTLKRFYWEEGRVRLQPANPTMEPIIIDDPSQVTIQGKVVLVLRQLN